MPSYDIRGPLEVGNPWVVVLSVHSFVFSLMQHTSAARARGWVQTRQHRVSQARVCSRQRRRTSKERPGSCKCHNNDKAG